MIKKKFLLVTLFCLVSLLTGCGSSLDDDVIEKDVVTKLESTLNEGENIESVEIISRDSDEESKDTKVHLKVISNEGPVEYERYYKASYSYDNKEWVLNKVDFHNVEEWKTTLVSGVTEEDVLQLLIGQELFFEYSFWEITEENVRDIKIVSQKTNPQEFEDEVVVEMTIDDDIYSINGQVEITCEFSDKWEMKSWIGIDFVGEYKDGYKPEEPSEEEFKSLIAQETFKISNDTSDYQYVSISESELSDFYIYSQGADENGTAYSYTCECILTKDLAIYELDLVFYYKYGDSGWEHSSTYFTYNLVSGN